MEKKVSDGEDENGEGDDDDDKLPHHPNHLSSIYTFYPIWTLSCMHLSVYTYIYQTI